MVYTGTVVVIPTRNRAAIAMNAIRSLLDQNVEHLNIMVSDNSTSETERKALKEFCASCSDPRVRYVIPPESLSMPAHWDWAIQEALQNYQATHFLYLTDRMMFRKGGLAELLQIAARYPSKLISFNHDRIIDNVNPIRVEQQFVSEKLLEVATLQLSRLMSQAGVIHHAVPRMLNCIVPRSIFDRIRERFGNIFSSVSPDFNFCCRCLEVEESILYYDKSLIFHYALSRSNGASATRGELTADYADFKANLPQESSMTLFSTPIPELTTAVNYAFHEYCLFKKETDSPKFFEINMQNYLQANAHEIPAVSDPHLKAELLSLLKANGYSENQTNNESGATVINFYKRLLWKIERILGGKSTTTVWLFLARNLSITPPGYNFFEFASLDEAIDYTRNISRGNFSLERSNKDLLNAREITKQ